MINTEKLKDFFPENQLEWRVQQTGEYTDSDTKEVKPYAMVLCYVQARAIENRLDEVVGAENWKTEFRTDGHNIICKLSIWDNDKKEWISKENGASETEIEAFKGGLSGAFKRVASHGWGIGRYLYELDRTYAEECVFEKPKTRKGWEKAKVRSKTGDKDIYWKAPKMKPDFLPLPKNEELEANM